MMETPTQLRIFHKFGNLPHELKDMIWTRAADARPSTPGAHMFHVHQASDGTLVPEGEDAVVTSSTMTPTVMSGTTVVVTIPHRVSLDYATAGERATNESPALHPQNREFEERVRNQYANHPIVDGIPNPSMYLVDGGLWTACKDSRWAMKKRFRSEYFESLLEKSAGSGPPYQEVVDLPATGYFIPGSRKAILGQSELGVGLEPWFFTVFPLRDLFIFPLGDVFAKCGNIPLDWFKSNSIMRLNPASGTRSWEHSWGFRNIAFTWNPAWDYEQRMTTEPSLDGEKLLPMNPEMVEGLFRIVASLEGRRDEPPYKVWIIDHRIKRRKLTAREMEQYGAAIEEKKEIVFYGTDRKYTAVQFGDELPIRELPIPWEIGREWCDSSGPALFIPMIRRYDQFLEEQIEDHLTDHGVLLDSRAPEVGLLACEILDEATATY